MHQLKDFEPLSNRWRARLAPWKQITLLPQSVRLRLCNFEIPAPESAPPLRGVYIGEGLSLDYYLSLYRARLVRMDHIYLWQLSAAVKSMIDDTPLVLVEINHLLSGLLPSGALQIAPWMEQETNLQGELYQKRRPGIENGWGQKVRRQAFHFTTSTELTDLECFYREYYLPYVKLRHGDSASVRGFPMLRRALHSGFLLKVWRKEQWVSSLLVFQDGQQRVIALADGLHESQFSSRQDGAIAAGHYFLFEWARNHGIERVNLCGARPHLLNGVLKHKQLWAAESRYDAWHHTRNMFYVQPGAHLPEAISKQVVEAAGAFVSIGEHLAALKR